MAKKSTVISSFRKLAASERLKVLCAFEPDFADVSRALNDEASLRLDQADCINENVAGRFTLPMGIATSFLIIGI